MTMERREFDLAEVAAGAVLAEPVLDSAGVTLLGAGLTLTARLLSQLADHGVARVAICVPLDEAEQTERRAGLDGRLRAAFGPRIELEPMPELLRRIVDFRMTQP